jgi:hypothetical protein
VTEHDEQFANEMYRGLSELPALAGDTPPHYRLKQFLFSNSLVERIVDSYEAFKKFELSVAKTQQSIERLQDFSKHEYSTEKYGYTNSLDELKTALGYKNEIERGFPRPGESKELYRHTELILSDLLEEAKYLVNFGVCYAYIDSILALKYPDVQIIGIDRSKFTKLLNEGDFSPKKNMQFVADDVMTFLANKDFENGVFFHTRTCCLLPKSFIELLYKEVAKAGFSQIVCIEQVGISRQTGVPYKFSNNDQPSVAFRWGMYIHNYPALLTKAGYTVTRAELLKTDHPHSDYRMLSITASRDSS